MVDLFPCSLHFGHTLQWESSPLLSWNNSLLCINLSGWLPLHFLVWNAVRHRLLHQAKIWTNKSSPKWAGLGHFVPCSLVQYRPWSYYCVQRCLCWRSSPMYCSLASDFFFFFFILANVSLPQQYGHVTDCKYQSLSGTASDQHKDSTHK